MKTLFKKENLKNTILTLVYLIFGVALLVSPVNMFNFVESALCFVLLAVGIVCVFIYSLMSADDKILSSYYQPKSLKRKKKSLSIHQQFSSQDWK